MKEHLLTEFSTIFGAGLSASSVLIGRLYREGTSAYDTYAYDAVAIELDLHYEINAPGSKTP